MRMVLSEEGEAMHCPQVDWHISLGDASDGSLETLRQIACSVIVRDRLLPARTPSASSIAVGVFFDDFFFAMIQLPQKTQRDTKNDGASFSCVLVFFVANGDVADVPLCDEPATLTPA